MNSLSPLPALDPAETHFGAAAHIVRSELTEIIKFSTNNSPRSLQSAIGPSELGTPCRRRLGFRLAGVEQHRRGGWLPTIGTAVHTWLAEAVAEYNERAGFARYLIETQVMVGEIGGIPIYGHADLYDRVTGVVVDWKIVGVTTLKRVKAAGPSPTYRSQLHLYGRGFALRGVPVHHVAIAYLPRSYELSGAHWHIEPYDESIALDALGRADAVQRALSLAGPELVLPDLPRADDCGFCPWHDQVGNGDPTTSCPGIDAGDDESGGKRKRSLAHSLIG